MIDASSRGADGVRTADVNGDGIPDLVAGWEQGGLTRVYVGSRAHTEGPRWRAVTVGQSPDVEDAVFFDADDDGVARRRHGHRRRLAQAPGPLGAAAVAATLPRTSGRPRPSLLTALNGCSPSRWMSTASAASIWSPVGRTSVRGSAGSRVRRSLATFRDWMFHRVSDVGWTMSLVVRDMNSDGRADILLSDRRGTLAGVRWLEHPGFDYAGTDRALEEPLDRRPRSRGDAARRGGPGRRRHRRDRCSALPGLTTIV